jgi:bifunctional UDP-N-acetylglucosamine pyrophosphorylase/glucosamine-1-phosphate N-acetyltransferase
MHALGGRPMIEQLVANAETVFDRVVVVVGPGMEDVARVAAPHATIVQEERLGTAHAALCAADLFGDGEVAILYGDNPLIRASTMQRLLAYRHERGADLALLAMRPSDPAGYGRVIVGIDGFVSRIVEHADASEDERRTGLCNAGVIAGDAGRLREWLRRTGNANAKGEYYLTDTVAVAGGDEARTVALEAPAEELRGVNSRAELAEAEAILQRMLRTDAMACGVTMVAPETVFLSADTRFEPDVVVEPHVVFGSGVTVATGARIRAFSHLEGCIVKTGAVIGPYARLRPGALIGPDAHVGNFVEVKATALGRGAKANHLAYLGDASVGDGTNIGAGTITCNYDGFGKHRTTIGANVFVGSDSVLVAPVTIGDGALIAAGSVITEDVEQDAMAFGRSRQVTKPKLAASFRRLKGK